MDVHFPDRQYGRRSHPAWLAFLVAVALLGVARAADEPLAMRWLRDGKLADGAKALEARLKEAPNDDQARFGLGVIQFFRAYERLGAGIVPYGVRTDSVLVRSGVFGGLAGGFLSQAPNVREPKPMAYDDLRRLLATWVDDLAAAEATLAAVKDKDVKLPLAMDQVRLDLFGNGELFSLATLYPEVPRQPNGNSFDIAFDRGDVCWLRGYLNAQMALGDILLALDGRELFERVAHQWVDQPVTPYEFLKEERRTGIEPYSRESISDLIALFATMRFPVREPARAASALKRLESTLAFSREMWTHYEAETDDDREWIPNPKQKNSALRTRVTQPMVDTWRKVLGEAELVVQGKRLLPFWRGVPGRRGLNLRRVFLEPKQVDVLLWVQGTAATPYLEQGPTTDLAAPQFANEIQSAFGGNFGRFLVWFN